MRKQIVVTLAMTALALQGAAVPAGAMVPAVNGRVAFDRADPQSPGDTFIVTANPDGSHAERLLAVHGSNAGWSHDGTKLAFATSTSDGRITTAIVNADGSNLTVRPLPDRTLNVACGAWSPDDTRLACDAWDDSDAARRGIYTTSAADGSGLTRLTSNPNGGDDQPGGYSPDGRHLVFLRLDADGNALGLFVINTDGTDLHRITPAGTLIQDGNDGDWSPHGNWIVFSRHVSSDVRGSIWMIHADGTGLHQIRIRGLGCGAPVTDPNGFGCHGVHWSPDGTQIIFIGNTSHGRNVYTAAADGSRLTQVTNDGADDNPAWGTYPPAR